MSENNFRSSEKNANIDITFYLKSNRRIFLKVVLVKNIIESFFVIFILFLNILLFIKGEFNNGYFKTLEKNWRMSPITNITIYNPESNLLSINKKQKNIEQYILDTFYGIKNLDKYNERINIFIWGNKFFEIELYKNYSYENIFKNSVAKEGKICGKDSEGFNLYFPSYLECPINYIEISNFESSKNTNISNITTFNLKNKHYLHLSRDNIEGKILTKLKISDKKGPCYNYDYDNSFGLYFNNYYYISNKIGCEFDDAYNDKFIELDNENILNILSQNSINLLKLPDLDKYLKNNSDLYLFYTGYIGINSSYIGNKTELMKYIGKTINMRNYVNIKNISLIAISIVFFIMIWVEGFSIQTSYLDKKYCSINLIISEIVFLFLNLLEFFIVCYDIFLSFRIKNYVLKYISIKYLWNRYENQPKFITFEFFIICISLLILIIHIILITYLFFLYKRHLVQKNVQVQID